MSMSRKEIVARILAEVNAVGYALGTVAQTYTAIEHVTRALMAYAEGVNDTDSFGDPDPNFELVRAATWTLFVFALTASMCKGESYFWNSRKTNFKLFSDLYDWLGCAQPENTMNDEIGLRISQKAASEEGRCKSSLSTTRQLWGAFGGTAFPNGISMLLQAINIGTPFWVAMALAMSVTTTSAVSVYSLFKYVAREKPVDKGLDARHNNDNDELGRSINAVAAEYGAFTEQDMSEDIETEDEKKRLTNVVSGEYGSFWYNSLSYLSEGLSYITGGTSSPVLCH